MRAAIYARMSTDRQSADSPADQVARCRDFAGARGWHVVEELITVEAGISGASRHNRPGLLGLLEGPPQPIRYAIASSWRRRGRARRLARRDS